MSFQPAPELESLSAAIRQVFTETFEHLDDAKIGYLFTSEEILSKGKLKAGYAIVPTAMGQNRKILNWALDHVFGWLPDALIVVHDEQWEGLSDDQRIALAFHEMRHLSHKHTKAGEPMYTEEGTPVIEIEDHDVEEFLSVAEIFGAWHEGLQVFGKLLQGKADAARIAEVKKLWKR